MDPGGTGLAGTGLRTAFLKNAPTYGQIAYTDVSAPTSHIRIAKAADGSGDQILLTGVDPAWSPGGAKLVYRTGQGLLVTNVDGSGTFQLTTAVGGPE